MTTVSPTPPPQSSFAPFGRRYRDIGSGGCSCSSSSSSQASRSHDTPDVFAACHGLEEAFTAWPHLETWGDVQHCMRTHTCEQFCSDAAPLIDVAVSETLYHTLRQESARRSGAYAPASAQRCIGPFKALLMLACERFFQVFLASPRQQQQQQGKED